MRTTSSPTPSRVLGYRTTALYQKSETETSKDETNKGPGARAGERSLGRGAKRIVLIPRDRPKPAARSDHFTKRAHHKASASQSERITKRARHKASMRRCTVSPLSRHNAVGKRGELFVTADLLLPSDCHCVARPLKTGRYPSTGADRDRGGPTGADRTPLGTPY